MQREESALFISCLVFQLGTTTNQPQDSYGRAEMEILTGDHGDASAVSPWSPVRISISAHPPESFYLELARTEIETWGMQSKC